ncbi:hypothetical protein F5144DRAFT_589920 [Chaetomium tenue]|uniref:Uncharacterized protein n=1 Tax=Chaetomium tenue TaxID=1854479 RepID=A0ACB7PL11_9PEZI|nr:hypothetical protein F5144DRAFT_589920 [Chaetomium globosum]
MRVHVFLLVLLAPCIWGISWRNEKKAASRKSCQAPQLRNIYAVALNELEELQSEPLCHRVAARLLVNNCQLVDGKNDATVLTDSGRQIRDFVDSYAASLAICDLERGSFSIPKECAKFREPSLSQIAMRDEPQLHVSSHEIGYRHKAVRFCEAARADNEKSSSILLYQRLTRVISQLTDGVEAELQKRMDDLDNRARQSVEALAQLTPHIYRLSEGLGRVEKYLFKDLDSALKKTSESYHDGLQHAENLKQLLSVLVSNALDSNSQMALAQATSLGQVEQASQRVSQDISTLLAVITLVATSTNSMQQQVAVADRQAALLAKRQDNLEQGMDRLVTATEKLSAKFGDHSIMIKQANNITNDILDALEQTAALASSVNETFLTRVSVKSWWPFAVFPAASLLFGSYRLPPSMLRNIGLLVFGEVIGFVVSSYQQLSVQFFDPLRALATSATNATMSSF